MRKKGMSENKNFEVPDGKTQQASDEITRNRISEAAGDSGTDRRFFLPDERLESIGLVSRRIAHDFNNVLGGILGYASFIKSIIEEDSSIYKYIDTIENSAVKGADITKLLLDFGRGEKPKNHPENINKVLEITVETVREKAGENISIVTDYGTGLPEVNGDREQLVKAFLNVLSNAVEAMPGGGRLTVETGNARPEKNMADLLPGFGGKDCVRIVISDTGCGIEEEVTDHIFEPLFTTKDKTKFAGFGLSIAYRIIRNHDGIIDCKTSVGEATTFEIFLPHAL